MIFPVYFYTLDSEFTFGKFKGHNVGQILIDKPWYVEWCLINIKNFVIDSKSVDVSDKLFKMIHSKHQEYLEDQLAVEYDKAYQEFLRLYDYKEEFEKADEEASEQQALDNENAEYYSYMKEITSDRFFIDNVLDGDEENYCNLD